MSPLGARDPESRSAACALGSQAGGKGLLTWDDALDRLPAPGETPRRPGAELAINLHVCVEEWVTDDGERLVEFIAALLGDLARVDGRRLRVLPLIAYEDERISERPALARLCDRLQSGGRTASIEPPVVLDPVSVGEHAVALGAAELTVGCSYHVALTSAVLGVPPVLVSDNRYYAQKSSGLRAAFELPEELLLRPPHPGAAATGIAATALGAAAAPLRESLLAAGRRLAAERDRGRATTGGALSRALIAGLTEREAMLGDGARRADQIDEPRFCARTISGFCARSGLRSAPIERRRTCSPSVRRPSVTSSDRLPGG